MDMSPPASGLKLDCRPSKEGRTLIFDYAVYNLGDRDVFVTDAMPAVDRATKTAVSNPRAVSVIHSPSGDAIIGKFIPPVPTSLRPAVPLAPLARRLVPGDGLERRLEVPEPLAETSPYLADLLLRQYEIVDVAAVVFTIGYWVSGGPGFAVTPASFAPGMFSVLLAGPVGMLASQRFATRGLQIFRRTDAFPRVLSGSA